MNCLNCNAKIPQAAADCPECHVLLCPAGHPHFCLNTHDNTAPNKHCCLFKDCKQTWTLDLPAYLDPKPATIAGGPGQEPMRQVLRGESVVISGSEGGYP